MSDQVVSQYAPIPGKIPGVPVKLGGREFIIPPLNLDGIQEVEPYLEKIGENNATLKARLENAIPVILVALKRNYTDITKADVSALVDLGNFMDVLQAVVSVSGFKQAPPGETAPPSP